jgi:hypothetical protein
VHVELQAQDEKHFKTSEFNILIIFHLFKDYYDTVYHFYLFIFSVLDVYLKGIRDNIIVLFLVIYLMSLTFN